jgi:hypothetical protein
MGSFFDQQEITQSNRKSKGASMHASLAATMTHYETLFSRHPANPILSGKDWSYSINSVFNPGVTLLSDGFTLLLCPTTD